jgi:hypothetical protein
MNAFVIFLIFAQGIQTFIVSARCDGVSKATFATKDEVSAKAVPGNYERNDILPNLRNPHSVARLAGRSMKTSR